MCFDSRIACRGFATALVTVFGTDSSIATLPVTLRCAAALHISEPVAQFVLPLGANINMNGTAFFEAFTVIFIAQASSFLFQLFTCHLLALHSLCPPLACCVGLFTVEARSSCKDGCFIWPLLCFDLSLEQSTVMCTASYVMLFQRTTSAAQAGLSAKWSMDHALSRDQSWGQPWRQTFSLYKFNCVLW